MGTIREPVLHLTTADQMLADMLSLDSVSLPVGSLGGSLFLLANFDYTDSKVVLLIHKSSKHIQSKHFCKVCKARILPCY